MRSKKGKTDCTGALEAFIGTMSFLLGVSLLLNDRSFIFVLLDYHGLRLPLAWCFIGSGPLALLLGGLSYGRWNFDGLRAFVGMCTLSAWIIYSWVANSMAVQFPVALMSFGFIPLLGWLVWRRVVAIRGE